MLLATLLSLRPPLGSETLWSPDAGGGANPLPLLLRRFFASAAKMPPPVPPMTLPPPCRERCAPGPPTQGEGATKVKQGLRAKLRWSCKMCLCKLLSSSNWPLHWGHLRSVGFFAGVSVRLWSSRHLWYISAEVTCCFASSLLAKVELHIGHKFVTVIFLAKLRLPCVPPSAVQACAVKAASVANLNRHGRPAAVSSVQAKGFSTSSAAIGAGTGCT